MTPQLRREKTLAALLTHLGGLAARQPVLMIYEDVHWIDPSSRELLDRVIEQFEHLPVLLLAIFRPEFQTPWLGQANATSLVLTRLNRRETAAMIAEVAGQDSLPAEIVQELADRTDGVPLFIEEVTKAALESGAQTGETPASMPRPRLAVPATLHSSLIARLDRLGPAAKDIAQKGAAIGREFKYELIASIADRPQTDLREALEQLTSAGLLFARGVPPASTYQFKHALVQDTAYGTLLKTQRQKVHRTIATVLEDGFSEIAESRPELLAWHFTEAGQAGSAVKYWLRAGEQALAQSSMNEAEALLRKGIRAVADLIEGVRRKKDELDLQIALGRALIATQGWGATELSEVYGRARVLCRKLNRPDKLAQVLSGEGGHWVSRAELLRAHGVAEELRRLSEQAGEVAAHVVACRLSGATCMYLGVFPAARSHYEQALSFYNSMQRRLEATVVDALVSSSAHLSFVLMCLGYPTQANSYCAAALVEARRLVSHEQTLPFALSLTLDVGRVARAKPSLLLQRADELLRSRLSTGFHTGGR